MNFYVGRSLFKWFKLLFSHINGVIFALIFAFIALSVIMAFLPIPMFMKGIMSWIGSYWMGIFIYFFLCFLVVDLVILLGSIVRIIPAPISPSIYFNAGLVAILLSVGFVSYGIYNANQIKYASYDIQLNEQALSNGMKIILISDLHLGAEKTFCLTGQFDMNIVI